VAYPSQCRFAQHDNAGNPPPRYLGDGWGEYEPAVTIHRMEFSGMDSEMTLAEMSACIVSYRETTNTFKPVALLSAPAADDEAAAATARGLGTGAADDGAAAADLRGERQDGGLRSRGTTLLKLAKAKGVESVIPKKLGEWIPPVVTRTVNQTLTRTAVVDNIGPVLETSFASLMVQVRGGWGRSTQTVGSESAEERAVKPGA
jgi:hypothetical protein